MSKKRQHRSTSKEAHESVKEHKEVMYDKIKDGLNKLKIGGHFEEIANACGLKTEQVWKRLNEMIELGMIYNVGITRPTSSGRKAMVRQLVGLKSYTEANVTADKLPVLDKRHKEPTPKKTVDTIYQQQPLFT